jgi:hypothetical protein
MAVKSRMLSARLVPGNHGVAQKLHRRAKTAMAPAAGRHMAIKI